MMKSLRVLLIEDSEDDAALLIRMLRKGGFEPDWLRVETARDMTDALNGRIWDVILCDFSLPQFSGPEAIALVQEKQLDIPIIVVSGAIGEEMAVECMRRGAHDYILKSNLSRLCPAIEREIAEAQTRVKRREAEEALRENERRLKEAQELARLGFWSWNVKTGQVEWSEQVYTIFQLDPAVFKPQIDSILELSPWPEDHARDQELIRRAMESREKGSYEQRFLRPDGSTGYYYSTFHGIYDDQGGLVSIVGTVQDITESKYAEEERRNLEKQLFSSQKMEAIGTLAGGIAHDFNNILSGIIGYAELLETEVDDASQKIVRRILNAADRARHLVKQILAFSRHMDQDKKPLDFRSVIREALNLLRATISTKIEINTSLPDDPVIVEADYTQMHQVIMNICTNAAQSMGEKGGRLEVSLGCEDVRNGLLSENLHLAPGCYAKMSITDTGQGIDPRHINRLFDPFFTTKDVGEGTGLGLAVVYGIVHNHGGGISVASQVGRGSTFNVFLPLKANDQRQQTIPEATMIPRGRERILFVDDEPELAELGRRVLSGLGYQVTGLSKSLEALEIYKASPGLFDLVITDMNMPCMSGDELACEILKIRDDQAIILCTGYSDYMDNHKAAAIGVKAFVLKPLNRKILAVLVRNVLDHHTPPLSAL